MATKSVHVIITGRVQGVWFRGWADRECLRLGLSGWIANLTDGRVEAVFCGVEEDVDQMLDLCWHGPGCAQVDDVVISPTQETHADGFRVRR